MTQVRMTAAQYRRLVGADPATPAKARRVPPVAVTLGEAEALRLKSVSEADFQRLVVAEAKAAGWLVQHSRTALSQSGRYNTPIQGHAGFPDLVLVHPSRCLVLFCELKKVGAYPKPDQRAWIEALRRAGQDVRIWRPTDWDEIREALS